MLFAIGIDLGWGFGPRFCSTEALMTTETSEAARTTVSPSTSVGWHLPIEWQRRYEAILLALGCESPCAGGARETAAPNNVNHTQAAKWIGVSGCCGGEGSSTIAAHLAVAAASGRSVLLVDGCADSPSQHWRFSSALHPGWNEHLLFGGEHPTAYVSLGGQLWMLPAGKRSSQSTRAHDLFELNAAIKEIAVGFDITVFDLPPVLRSSLTLRFAGLLDAMIVVAAAGRTTRDQVSRAVELIGRARGRVEHVILNYASE